MSLKQTPEQYEANIAALEKSLLPAILAATAANGQMISGYLLRNFQTDGIVDASVENLRKAVLALRDHLEWIVPPAKRPGRLSDFSQSRDQDPIRGISPPDPVESKPTKTPYEQAMQNLNNEHDQLVLSQARAFIDAFGAGGMRHSQRFAAKDKLQARWNELLQQRIKPSVAFDQLKAFSETLWAGPAWQPNREKSR